MISRKQKELFYTALGPFMQINGLLYKLFKSPSSNNKKTYKVHLGPGKLNYLNGWINIDANIFSGKADLWADLRNPLPFKNESLDIIYSHHVIEHLPNLEIHFKEVYRTLKKGGKIRIGGPNGDSAIKKFVEGDHSWFVNFPDDRKSIGGKFENYIFCRQEHLTILTFSFLEELLTDTGFKSIKLCLPKQTNLPNLVDQNLLDHEWEFDFSCPNTLLVEAEK